MKNNYYKPKFYKKILTVFCFTLISFSCKKYYSYERAFGSLKDSIGECLTVTSKAYGNYYTENVLTSQNYILAPVTVIIPGPYTIKSDTLNGYSFSASGIFTHKGKDTVKLMGTGKPLGASVNNFLFSFDTSLCYFGITVKNKNPIYDGILTFELDGVKKDFSNFSSAQYLYSNNSFMINCGFTNQNEAYGFNIFNAYGGITATIYNSLTSYPIECNFSYENENNGVWISWIGGNGLWGNAGTQFVFNITKLSATRIIGTFYGTVVNNSGNNPNYKSITNGIFNLPLN